MTVWLKISTQGFAVWYCCHSNRPSHVRLDNREAGSQCCPYRSNSFYWLWQHVHIRKWEQKARRVKSANISVPHQHPTQTYMIDAYTKYASSAIAASSVLRSLAGALLPLAGIPMYDRLGLGWGNTLLAFLALVIGILPLYFNKYGEVIRKKYPIDLD